MKRHRTSLAHMGKYVDVQSPSIGDIDPVTLTLATCTSSKVVSMKISDDAITWLGRAVAHQMSSIESDVTHDYDQHQGQGHIDAGDDTHDSDQDDVRVHACDTHDMRAWVHCACIAHRTMNPCPTITTVSPARSVRLVILA